MKYTVEGNQLTIFLAGIVDTNNARAIEDEMQRILVGQEGKELTLDVSDLTYISSAGLRVLMRLNKQQGSLTIVNASPQIYEILDMTGFTELMDVRRALRTVSIDGLEMIGAGANGRVFRLDEERIIKVYNPVSNTPEKIMRERQVARQVFVAGVPSAISFEMVRVADGLGIIYEMIDALTLGEAISRDPERLEEYSVRMAKLLQELHGIEFKEGELPDARDSLHAWVDIAGRSGYYDSPVIAAAHRLADSIPPRNTFVHGDFHPGNIMVTNDDEFLLIDMGDASMGDPIIDLMASYQIIRIVADQPGGSERYMGLTREQAIRVWDVFVRTYYGVNDPEQIEAIERKLKFHMILRSLAGITFSEVISEDRRRNLAAIISEQLLKGMAALGLSDTVQEA